MEINPKIERALEILDSGVTHVFITGRAGTGKSTLLRHFLEEAAPPGTVVLAPTGVAAINVGGETIHHFFKLRPGTTPEQMEQTARRLAKSGNRAKIYRELTTLVIDEFSMVRADLLDMVDGFLRIVRGNDQPFGGVRLVGFGDLYQLPPVVQRDEWDLFRGQYHGPYFFDSHVFQRILREAGDTLLPPFRMVELTEIYRQTDPEFIEILQRVRERALDEGVLARINSRHNLPPAPGAVHLTTTNATARRINAEHLKALPGEMLTAQAEVTDEFPRSYFPTDDELNLKIGARIMLLTNDPDRRWFNGSLGTLKDIEMDPGEEQLVVALDDGETVRVPPFEWEVAYNYWDVDTESIQREVVGSFEQFPARLAWAVTIHKSQGKTFDHMVVDFERAAFAHGQAYVALSRCRTLEGLVLARPMRADDVRLDHRVQNFLAYARTLD